MSKSDNDRPHVELFTDGACSGNPGPGGWAYILRDLASGREVEESDGEASTTNNRMELLGAINGLERLERPSRVDLYSDSQYVVKGLSEWMDGWKAKGWRRSGNSPVKNVELWKRLDQLRKVHDLNAVWVRGHSDHPENERCDQLAVAAAARFRGD
ncbi:MAG: ribonuclease HI [Planctomycetota bacterium]|jgi:ribonuclease HI